MIGKTLLHYRITEQLGAGGMGVVYKAEDTRLKRTVALKFLPPELTCDPEAKARFIREAQAASALQHNNICTIHDVDETKDGRLFIVMDHYIGENLGSRIKEKGLSTAEVIDLAIQIGQGLARAHEKGIIHRDIKPANVFLTIDGIVKILDFGLAKLAGQARLTRDFSTLGTVAYMSPEQLRGDEIDHRADIWSLGVVLFEMLTGELPFKGDYEQAMIYSIMNEEPEQVTAKRPEVPREVEYIVNKSLSKNANKRYQNVSDLLTDLKSLKKASRRPGGVQMHFRVIRRPLKSILAGIVLFAVLSAAYLLSNLPGQARFQVRHTFPITAAPGLERDPSWSPEGTRIAYASDEAGNMDIWVQQISAGQKLNLTVDYDGYDGKPAWSPDGEWIAFASERDGGGIYSVPALGGIPKRIIQLSFSHTLSGISWSPDGEELAYAIDGVLYTVPADGGTPVPAKLPSKGLVVGFREPAWSPDGERIACTGKIGTAVSNSQIWSIKYDGSDPVAVTEGQYYDHCPVWSPDGKQLFFVSDRGGSKDIWWVSVNPRGKPAARAQRLTAGAGAGTFVLSKNTMKLVYTKLMERSNIWSIPIDLDRKFRISDALQITSENQIIERVSVSPDTEWIAFDSNRSGNTDIWIMRKNGSALRQLTTNPAHDWGGLWSPDGNQIAFHSLRNGNRDVYLIPVSGGAEKRLTSHPADDFIMDWSPDGKKILFSSNRSGNMDIWTIPSGGGEPLQLTFHKAREWVAGWSPDGKQLVFSSDRTGNAELFLMPAEGGIPLQLTRGEWLELSPLSWSSDGQTIFANGKGGPGNEGPNLWAISVLDGKAQSLLDLSGYQKDPGILSSDGEKLYFSLWEQNGDLWMMELSFSK